MLNKGCKVVQARSMQIALLVFRHATDAYVTDNLIAASIIINDAILQITLTKIYSRTSYISTKNLL